MENFDSSELIERIEDAKGWLEKAKDEYNKENPVRGGLILNLAQAEVKHAWELSTHQFVTKSNRRLVRGRKSKYFLPVAASLVLFASLVVGAQIAGKLGGGALPIPGKASISNVAKSKAKPFKKAGSSELNLPKLVSAVPEEPEGPLPSQTDNPGKTKMQVVTAKSSNPRISGSGLQHSKEEVIPSKPVLKPVSQLSIDEEALTKEASHSLRNGK